MRVVTQTLTAVAADPNGFSTDQDYSADDFIVLDGALSSTNIYNGVKEINLSAQSVGTLVGFTTGLTGSVGDVTIIGRDINGNPFTEVVTMPGASSAVSSVVPFSFITSMQIDAVATNLQVGIISGDDQVGRWVPFDTYQNPFEVALDVEEVTDGATYDVEITNDTGIFRPNSPEPDNFYVADAPFAAATASQHERLLVTPAVAARIKMTTPGAGVLKARWVQSGGGFR